MHSAFMSSCSSSSGQAPAASSGCGCGQPLVFDGATTGYKRILAAVIVINVVGFAVVAVGSLWADSASSAANALDFGADAATYALSLWAIGQSAEVRAGAALFKSATLGAMAVGILGLAMWRAFYGAAPEGAAPPATGAGQSPAPTGPCPGP